MKYIVTIGLAFILHSPCWAIQEAILYGVNPIHGGGNQDIHISEPVIVSDIKIDIIEYSHDWLKNYIDSLSHNVDSFVVDTFFGDDILDDDVSGSRAKLSFYTRRVLGQPVDYKFGLSVKLVLPNTDEKFNLLVESSDEDGERDNNLISTVEKVEYSTALRYIIEATEDWRVDFDTGIKWGIPTDPFTRLKMRRYTYFEQYRLRTTQTFSWSVIKGLGEKTDFELSHPLNIDRLIRFNFAAEYMLENDYIELSYGATLFHELNAKEILAYYFRASGDVIEDPTFTNYGVGIRYRRQVYQDWVFAEVSPELETSRFNNYDLTPVIMFRFEALVGRL